ncbi:MAG TPA: cbb3-type cytochrome c oxidase subunit 3 [Burkholderiaceae bacterium]|jgi:cytochrome c oxidase cbb3-type subunit 4|nr:cbb3-type cytochrome c oxidase subunit 3 [Burkholderiaceae bacterium]
MDFTEVRIVWTVLSFVIFIAILVWAYSKRARSAFDAAARLPFADDAGQPPGESGAGGTTV